MDPNKIKESIQAIIDGLTPLAQKMQIPIGNLWEWSIKHNYAVAISQLLFFALTIILTGLEIKLIIWGNKKVNKTSSYSNFDHSQFWPYVVLFLGIALMVFWLGSLITIFSETVIRFVSPEWMTIKDLTGLVVKTN
jgi:hypothetical protein